MLDDETIATLAAYAGLALDQPNDTAGVRQVLEWILPHRSVVSELDLVGTRPGAVFCFHHAYSDAGDDAERP